MQKKKEKDRYLQKLLSDIFQEWLLNGFNQVAYIASWINTLKPGAELGIKATSVFTKSIAEDGFIGKVMDITGYGKRKIIEIILKELIDKSSMEPDKKVKLKRDEELFNGMVALVNVALEHVAVVKKALGSVSIYSEFFDIIKAEIGIKEAINEQKLAQEIEAVAKNFLEIDFPVLEKILLLSLSMSLKL